MASSARNSAAQVFFLKIAPVLPKRWSPGRLHQFPHLRNGDDIGSSFPGVVFRPFGDPPDPFKKSVKSKLFRKDAKT